MVVKLLMVLFMMIVIAAYVIWHIVLNMSQLLSYL